MPEVIVEGIRVHYREAGEGPPVLLLHGWPTSSFLYREVMKPLAAHNRVVAMDLPGFGASDKPLGPRAYTFRAYQARIDGFLEALGIAETGLVVHDLGGPVGLYWAVHQLERVTRLALLNTIVYPQVSWAVAAFAVACRIPGPRGLMTSAYGLRKAMEVGMATAPSAEVVAGVQAPFASKPARTALLQAALQLNLKKMREIEARLPGYTGPVRCIYGTADRILPDVARTMARVKRDLPQAEVTALDGCGHFLQEDRPDEVGALLAEFFRA